MIGDSIVEALIMIGNSKAVITECEPQVCFHESLTVWMIRRTLRAIEILNKLLEKNRDGETTG